MEDSFFEWDEVKAEENIKDHGVTFIEARSIFQDPGCVEIYDEAHSEEEGRYVGIGFFRQSAAALCRLHDTW